MNVLKIHPIKRTRPRLNPSLFQIFEVDRAKKKSSKYLVDSLEVGVFIGRLPGLVFEVSGVDVEAAVGRGDVCRNDLKYDDPGLAQFFSVAKSFTNDDKIFNPSIPIG